VPPRPSADAARAAALAERVARLEAEMGELRRRTAEAEGAAAHVAQRSLAQVGERDRAVERLTRERDDALRRLSEHREAGDTGLREKDKQISQLMAEGACA
jgi:hypothetical protein